MQPERVTVLNKNVSKDSNEGDKNVKSSKVRFGIQKVFGQDGRTGIKFTFLSKIAKKKKMNKTLKSHCFTDMGHQQQRMEIPNKCKHPSN